MTYELRHGRYQEMLVDVECDAMIADTPFGKRTHKGQRHGRKDPRYCNTGDRPLLSARGHSYACWGEDDVVEFVRFWHPRSKGWFVTFTSHDLVPFYERELKAQGRYVHAPIACVQMHRNVRLAGDGPSNWADYLVCARPRWGKGKRWGALPGAYVGKPFDVGENMLDRSKRVTGGKPLWLMLAIVSDYSRPGDLVCDPCAGGGTTLLAAVAEGRSAVGAEVDPEAFGKASIRLANQRRQTEKSA